ncbi:MAG TPA: glycosyltransferase family 2 protein [Hanamia sp.]|nr:glycosyltransferase family 2 protein [Hanamia sp.]
MAIDIVIVNWNSSDYLLKCIQSVFTERNELYIGKVFIIDNHSSDDSLIQLPTHHKQVIIKNAQNNGFAKAANQGFKLCTAAYILLLNPDARLLESTLEDCISFMEKEPGVDILGCRLLDDNGEISPSCARFPTPLKMFADSIGLSKISPSLFKPAILMSDWDHKTSCYVDQVMGAFMLMRHSVFGKVGYFDEQFFVYSEELDFSKRLSDIGGKSYFNTDIIAMHSGQGTTKEVKGFRLFLNLRSRLLYAKKHFNYGGYLLVGFGTFFIEPFSRIFFLLIKGNFSEIKEVIKGYQLLLAKQQR